VAGDDVLARLRRVRGGDPAVDPALLAALGELVDPVRVAAAGRLLEGLGADRIAPPEQRFRRLRVAVAGTFTVDGLGPLLRVRLLASGIEPELHLTGYDQLAVELSDPRSGLARFRPDVVLCLLHDQAFLPRGWAAEPLPVLHDTLLARLDLLEQAVSGFTGREPGPVVLLHTVPLSAVERSTVLAYRDRAVLGRIWRALNSGLLELAERHPRVHTLDLEAVLVEHPGPVRDDRLAAFAGLAWSAPTELCYAREAAAFCRAVAGRSSKLLVLDLDNTLWGGVLGEDGPTGIQLGTQYPGSCYTDLQHRVRALRRQGVLLAVCSKNQPEAVAEVFDHHPELVLRSGDLVAQAVNWGRKDHNIARLARTLNLGLDSVVFVDDSRFECELVRHELPQVRVVQLAGDPAGYARTLLTAGYFDVLATTPTDRERTELYRTRAGRQRFAASFQSAADYLDGLQLRVTVRPADRFSAPRLEQLARRTNQFNMTGEPAPPADLTLGFEVADRFGREGVVGGVWLTRHERRWRVENFVMSCRVFSRGVEKAVLQRVVDLAIAGGAAALEASFRHTGRNGPAAGFYPATGFRVVGERDGLTRYRLALSPRPELLPHWIALEGGDGADG
jgi:FkbH-like protein